MQDGDDDGQHEEDHRVGHLVGVVAPGEAAEDGHGDAAGGRAGTPVGEADDDVVGVEEVLEPEHGVDDHVARHERQRDGPELPPGGGAVQGRGLVHVLGDREQPRQVDDQRAGDGLPRRDQDDGDPRQVGVGQQAGLQPGEAQGGGQRGQRGGEQVVEHERDDDAGDDHGQEEHAPQRRLELDAGVQPQGQDEGHGVDEHHGDHGEPEGEPVGRQHVRVGEQDRVVGQPDEAPVAEPDVVREADDGPGQRGQGDEDGEEEDGGQQEEVGDAVDASSGRASALPPGAGGAEVGAGARGPGGGGGHEDSLGRGGFRRPSGRRGAPSPRPGAAAARHRRRCAARPAGSCRWGS